MEVSPSNFLSFCSLFVTISRQSPSAECFSSRGLPVCKIIHQFNGLLNFASRWTMMKLAVGKVLEYITQLWFHIHFIHFKYVMQIWSGPINAETYVFLLELYKFLITYQQIRGLQGFLNQPENKNHIFIVMYIYLTHLTHSWVWLCNRDIWCHWTSTCA